MQGHAAQSLHIDLELGAARHDLGRQEIHRADEIRHPLRRGLAVQPLGLVQLRDLAVKHHRDAVRHDQRLFLVMRHQHEGDADLALQLDQFHLHLLADLLVQRRQGLVQQQHFRLQDQRPRQGHPLPLPARQGMRRAVPKAGQPDQRERLVHFPRLFVLAPWILAQTEANVLLDRQMREDRIALKHHIRRPVIRRHPGHALAVDQHLPARDILEPRHGAQQRGLAAAGRSQQREELTAIDRGGDAAQRVVVAVVFLHAAKFDHRRGVGRNGHRKPPVSLPPVRASPRRRKYSAVVSRRIDRQTRIVPSAMMDGTLAGKRNWPKI